MKCTCNNMATDDISTLPIYFPGDGFACKEIFCGGAGILPFGTISGNNFKLGGIVTYSCDVGYRLEGPNQRTCLENGKSFSKVLN